jgi:hypothetical protein
MAARPKMKRYMPAFPKARLALRALRALFEKNARKYPKRASRIFRPFSRKAALWESGPLGKRASDFWAFSGGDSAVIKKG